MIGVNTGFSRVLAGLLLLIVVVLGLVNLDLYVKTRVLEERLLNLERELTGYYRWRAKWSSLGESELRNLLKSAVENASRLLSELDTGNPYAAVLELYEWILLNLYYQYDPGVLYVENDRLVLSYEYLQTPLETVLRRGGDCEDLSLLAYGVLVNKGFKAWIIVAKTYRLTHVFVVAWFNNTWFLVDPAANFLNGYSAVFTVETDKDILLIPLQLVSPVLKKKLVEQGFQVKWVYTHLAQTYRDTTYSPENLVIEEYPDLTRIRDLRSLLLAWSSNLGLPVVTLFSTFDVISIDDQARDLSFDQLVNYLEARITGSS